MKYQLTTIPGKAGDWAKAVAVNSDGGYSEAVLQVVEKLGRALDKGKTPKQAERLAVKDSGITGFQAGIMASIITQLHPRGPEFRDWWNSQYDVPAGAKGAVNPAIVTIKE